MKIVNLFIKNIGNSIIKDNCFEMASVMAFNLILTIFPFFVTITAIFGTLGTEKTIQSIVSSIRYVAPASAISLIEQTLLGIKASSSSGVITISFFIGILFASNVIKILVKYLNRAYEVPETRPSWKIRGITLWIIILFIIAVFLITNLIILGKLILSFLSLYMDLHNSLVGTLSLARWPVTFLMLFIIGFIIYYFIPNISTGVKNRILSSLPGTLFFTAGWLSVSWIFSLYVNNFSQLNKFYGAIGAVIILLLWLYYTSLVILIGGEINSEFYKYIKTKGK